ncbi:MAG: CAP domain-containing protein [Gaiellaceae bacterium]
MGLRLTRTAVVAALALLSVGAAGANAVGPPVRTVSAVNQLESQVLGQLNAVRRQHGLAPLRLSRPLSAAADAHSRSMGKFGFFSHESRDGSEFWTRVKRWYGPGGYRSWAVGENLLWSSGQLSAGAAVKLWMESPGHRKNILTRSWREVGLSAVAVSSAPGVFGGRDVVIITTDFGTRS